MNRIIYDYKDIFKKEELHFKKNDLVQFKTWDEMVKEYGAAYRDAINCPGSFMSEMEHLCGTYARIENLFYEDELECDSTIVKLCDFTTTGYTHFQYTLSMVKKVLSI